MNDNASKIWLSVIGLVLVTLQTSAQSEDSPHGGCPINYTLMGAVCLNEATGDVVNRAAVAPEVLALSARCRSGYELIQQVCISPSTGDVELPSSADR